MPLSYPEPPRSFRSLDEANLYLRELHRALESSTTARAANKTNYLLGAFTEDYALDTTLTTAELQIIVQTLIANLTDYGIINSKRG